MREAIRRQRGNRDSQQREATTAPREEVLVGGQGHPQEAGTMVGLWSGRCYLRRRAGGNASASPFPSPTILLGPSHQLSSASSSLTGKPKKPPPGDREGKHKEWMENLAAQDLEPVMGTHFRQNALEGQMAFYFFPRRFRIIPLCVCVYMYFIYI